MIRDFGLRDFAIRRFGLAVAMLFALTAAAAAQTQIWLAPLSTVSPHGDGEADFMQLATNPANWAGIAKHTAVFKLYPFFVGRAPEADVKAIIDEMKTRGIALAFEGRVLTTSRGCKMPQGDGGQVTMHLLQRIKDLGGQVAFFSMDEPLKHALTGEAACHASIADTARDMAVNIRNFRTIFPQMAVGDIEPVGTWSNAPTLLADTLAWVKAYQAAVGQPMAFFHADVGWTTQWTGICANLQRSLAGLHVPFGMIYNGTDLAPSPKAWTDEAREHFHDYEDGSRPPPAMAIFQSWVKEPTSVLPESDPKSLTGVASAYLAFRHMS